MSTLAALGHLALAAAPPGLTPTPIAQGCPWYDLSQYGLPNVNWCEETICAVVNEPANAWSNLAYLLVAALMWTGAQKLRSAALRRFAPAAALVGIGSFVYHASNVYLTQVLDFLGMFVFCYLLLFLNAQRLAILKARAATPALVAAVVFSTALTAGLQRVGFPIQSLIGSLILGIIATEVVLRRRAAYPMRSFVLSFLFLTAGAVCSYLDLSRRVCDPTSHILQGHAAWHVLGAVSLLFSFFHYRQFDAELAE